MEDLEKLYSPSKWSKRMSGDEILGNHVKFLNDTSYEVRNQINCDLNIAYGDGPREKYDILGTDLLDDSPILAYVHGGYYQEKALTHENCHFLAQNFHRNGIKTITVGYELCPNKSIEEILESLQTVLKICVQYAGKHKSRGLYLAGHSVGAHALATVWPKFQKSLAVEDQKLIKAVFLIAGVYDFVPITKMSANVLLKITEEVARRELSPLYFRHKFKDDSENMSTKFFVVAAEFDSPAFVEQSRAFFETIQENGINSEYFLIKNVDHFDIIENLVDKNFELTIIILNAINSFIK